MKQSKPKKKAKLRIKIILFSIITCMTSLIICGATIFFTYISSSSSQIENELSFFLTETTNNLDDKATLIEDIVLRVRNNTTMMNSLHALNQGWILPYDYSVIQNQFKKCVDIHSKKNTEDLKMPLLQNVYLFANADSEITSNISFKSMFLSYLLEKEQQIDKEFNVLYQDFCNSGKDLLYKKTNSTLLLSVLLYDEQFDAAGTLIFEINLETLKQIMDSSTYQGSFWFIFSNEKDIIVQGSNSIPPAYQKDLMEQYKADIFEYNIGNTAYLINTKHMGLGLGSALAIPRNYITTMLYSSIKVYIYMLIFLAISIFVLTFFIIYKLTKPLKIVEEKIKLVEQGEFNTKLPDFNSLEFSDISHVFNAMTDRINYLINDVFEKKITIKESELKLLQAQMNPHFMFNVLNTIALQSKLDGNEKVYQMIHSFSLLTQAKIYKNGKDKIKVSEELEYVNFYLYLQKCRYDDKLNYTITISDEFLQDLFIPKLSIQPIVENAVVHGIEPSYNNGVLLVNIYGEEDILHIIVTDNGVGFNEELHMDSPLEIQTQAKESHNNVGLTNVHKIIQHFYGNSYGVTVTSTVNAGTIISITMPFDKGETNV